MKKITEGTDYNINDVIDIVDGVVMGMRRGFGGKVKMGSMHISGYFVYPWLFRVEIIRKDRKPLQMVKV